MLTTQKQLNRIDDKLKVFAKRFFIFCALVNLASVSLSVANGYDGKPLPLSASEKPEQLSGVGITEKLGAKIDLDLQLMNEKGQVVRLGSFYDGKKPVVISMVYFGCPGLCNFHLNGVIDTLKELDWSAGEKFEVLAISFDSHEGSELAAKKKESYMKIYNRPAAEAGFHFLTASEATIKKITEQIGFQYRWSEKTKEWAHASAAVVTTHDGMISRYLHGIMFDAKTFRLSLVEATNGKIGSLVDRIVWYCFHYDPQANKYALTAFRIVQVAAFFTVLILSFWLIPFLIRARRTVKSAS